MNTGHIFETLIVKVESNYPVSLEFSQIKRQIKHLELRVVLGTGRIDVVLSYDYNLPQSLAILVDPQTIYTLTHHQDAISLVSAQDSQTGSLLPMQLNFRPHSQDDRAKLIQMIRSAVDRLQ